MKKLKRTNQGNNRNKNISDADREKREKKYDTLIVLKNQKMFAFVGKKFKFKNYDKFFKFGKH